MICGRYCCMVLFDSGTIEDQMERIVCCTCGFGSNWYLAAADGSAVNRSARSR